MDLNVRLNLYYEPELMYKVMKATSHLSLGLKEFIPGLGV